MKLVDLARESTRLLKESYPEGIRSDKLAELLGVPKRRVYDVIAVLRALDLVITHRKYDGTTVTWIDRTAAFVSREEHDEVRHQLAEVTESRKLLQVEVAELKEELRITKTKISRAIHAVVAVTKTEFNTTQLKIRALSSTGFKRVRDAGLEVIIETHEPGMLVDPTVEEVDERESLIRQLQRV